MTDGSDSPAQMSPEEFREHIHSLADQIRTTAANKIIEVYQQGHAAQLNRIQREHNINLHVEDPQSLESYRSYLRDRHFSWVNDYFTRAANLPDPAASTPPLSEINRISGKGELEKVENLEDAAEKNATMLANLDPEGSLLDEAVFERVPTINDKVAPWKSGAVDMFKEYFLPTIPAAINHQILVAKVLRNVLHANQTMLAFARNDVVEIAKQTITAIEFEDGFCSGDNDTTVILGTFAGVATIVAGVASLPWTGGVATGPLVAGGVTILAGSASTWTSLDSRSESSELPLSADTVEGILANMATALDKTYSDLDAGNEALTRDVLAVLHGSMLEHKLQFVAPRPVTLADATRTNITNVVEGP